MAKQKTNRKPENLWQDLAWDNETFWGSLVLALLALLVAGFLAYVNFGAYWLYAGAPYQIETEARLVRVDKVRKEQLVHDDYYEDDTPAERDKHTKTEKYDLYVLHWEYELRGETVEYTTTDKYLSARRVGDRVKLRLYSDDGVEYKRASHNALSNGLMFLSGAASLFLVYAILRLLIARLVYRLRS